MSSTDLPYRVDGIPVTWPVYKRICKKRCRDANKSIRGLGSWAFGGDPNYQIKINKRYLKEHLASAKPCPRVSPRIFEAPDFNGYSVFGTPV